MKLDSPAFKLLCWIAWIGMGVSLFFHIRLMTLFPDSRVGFVGPLIYSQGRALALGVFLFIFAGVFALWRGVLNKKWKIPEFRRKTDWIVFAALAIFLYVVLVWPWWFVAAVILIPPLVAWNYHKISSLEGSSKGSA
jgi:hypothetical protein